jgi:hypothetical protein
VISPARRNCAGSIDLNIEEFIGKTDGISDEIQNIQEDSLKRNFSLNLNHKDSIVLQHELGADFHVHDHQDHVHIHEHFHGSSGTILITTIGLVVHSLADGFSLGAATFCKFWKLIDSSFIN